MKNFSYYGQTSVSLPKKDDYLTTYFYKKGRLVSVKTGNYFDEDFKVPQGCVEEHHLDEDSFEAHRELYVGEIRRLQEEFKNDLFEEYSMTNHPRAEECFNLAWNFGSSNLEEVEYYFQDIIKLVLKDKS